MAISRAQGLAVLVCEPALLRVACRTPEQMRLVNALCRLVEIATKQESGGAGERRRSIREPDEPPTLGLV